jgi:DNA-binding GntR family transcriptional regulator
MNGGRPPAAFLDIARGHHYSKFQEFLKDNFFAVENHSILNIKSLKEQVYEYLREQMRRGRLLPGSAIAMEETSKKLGVSKTPLRDALLQLEMEGFVTILPRRGVVVNSLSIQDIRDYYEIIGALESTALLLAFDRLEDKDMAYLERMNAEMNEAIDRDDFDLYYEKNLNFHNVFLNLCGNRNLVKIAVTLKKRLYDFPRQPGFVKEWEVASIGEHRELVGFIKAKNKKEAVNFIRDVHWSFRVQEKYISRYYTKAATQAG